MNCTIIVSHYESLPFLRACIRQIRKYKHPEIEQHIIIADQSRDETYFKLYNEFDGDDITVCQTKPLYSGYGIDWVMRNIEIKTDYICQLHVDAFPIHKNWLYLSIKLIEENNFAFVGQLHFFSRPTDTIYPAESKFFSMSPTFNVAKTSTYKEMSLDAGFTRYHERAKTDLTFNNNDWEEWAKEDYWNRGSDDDVPAFCWEDKHRQHDKLGLAITGMIGVPGEESGYGRIIEDMVFHFGFCRESIGVGSLMGSKYVNWTKRINRGFSDELIEEMIKAAKQNKSGWDRNVWDGKLKVINEPGKELNNKIEDLKKC